LIITAEQMAMNYWRRMRRASLREVEQRLAQLRTGSPATLRYWLEVHSFLEKKALIQERNFGKPAEPIANRIVLK